VLRTPNRRLLDRKLIFDFARPFDLIPKYTEKCERSPAAGGASGNAGRDFCPLGQKLLLKIGSSFVQ